MNWQADGVRLRHFRGGQGFSLRFGRLVVVQEWERLVLFRRGSLLRTVGPGGFRAFQMKLRGWLVDIRPWVLPVPVQEVPTSDGVTVKVSVVTQVRVTDPELFITASQDPVQLVYLLVQIALRDFVASTSIDELFGGRAAASAQLVEAVSDVSTIGVAIDRLELKDIVLPTDLKRAQAEVLLARAQGQATIERARSETAALRSLLNAAKLALRTRPCSICV